MDVSLFSKCSKELWDINGFISIEFDLYVEDITCTNKPDPIIVLASRYSYLPIVARDVIQYYQQSVLEFSSDIWFESYSIPLKSNIPLGVLYDLYGCTPSSTSSLLNWKIIIRFKDFPTQLLFKCSTISSIEKFYFHSLKQAIYTLHGNTISFNQLSVDNQMKLWTSIKLVDHQLFEEIINNAEFRPKQLLQQQQHDEDDNNSKCYRHIILPIRILYKDKPTLQKPIILDNMNKTLYDVIYHDFNINNTNSVNTTTNNDNNNVNTTTTANKNNSIIIQVKIHGIIIPMSAPIFELWLLMCHCDLFLYITLITTTITTNT